jgi:hypothetical protein
VADRRSRALCARERRGVRQSAGDLAVRRDSPERAGGLAHSKTLRTASCREVLGPALDRLTFKLSQLLLLAQEAKAFGLADFRLVRPLH